MRALLLFLAPMALAQPPSPALTVTAYGAAGQTLCAESGRWTNEPGVAEVPRACFTAARRIAARTASGAELPLASVRGESAAEDRLLLGFTLPAQPAEMLFGAYRSPLAGGRTQALAQWRAALDPETDRALRAGLDRLNHQDPAGAARHFLAAAARRPASAEAWFLLATARERSGDAPGQITALERAVSTGAIHRAALERLLVAYMLADRRPAAEALVRRVRPTSPDLAATLGTLLEQMALNGAVSGAAVSGALQTGPPAAPPQ